MWYSDESELAVPFKRELLNVDAVVIAHKWYRKLKLLNFVTFLVRTDPPRAAPTRNSFLSLVDKSSNVVCILFEPSCRGDPLVDSLSAIVTLD